MNFEEALAVFKGKEQPEDVLPLVGKADLSDELRKITLAWQKMKIERRKPEGKAPEQEKALWDWLWEQADYDIEELQRISGVSRKLSYHIEILSGNRIIYPDGTITTFASKALKQYMKKELNL